MIVLASQSPRRKKLLESTGLSFVVQPSSCEESYNNNASPEQIVQELALRKAKDVAKETENALIIGADTLVVLENRILEKPASEDEAIAMLKKLSGRSHEVLTGVALVKTEEAGNISSEETFFEKTMVFFGEPDVQEISRYVAGGSPMDKAGAYGIQDDWGSLFVKRIEGDYNNVVGLPLFALYQHLKTFAPEYAELFSITKNYA